MHAGEAWDLRERRVHAPISYRGEQGHGQRPEGGAEVLRARPVRRGSRACRSPSDGSREIVFTGSNEEGSVTPRCCPYACAPQDLQPNEKSRDVFPNRSGPCSS